MARTTFKGYTRNQPTRGATVAVQILAFRASFDPTSSTQVSLGTLPKGARPLGVHSLGGATGGTNPTVDIGSSGDNDGFAAELDADDVAFNGSGALTGAVLAADTEVFGKVGASAATGGTTTVVVTYAMDDDGALGDPS